MVVAAVVAEAAVAVTLVVVVVSLGNILCVQIVGFLCFLKRRTDGWTDGRTYGQTLL